ncbi:hypothetical protein J6590_090530 [Homalodisca vitripennis]|nr:hypothetical protein J6590_090530 [Homalodisca vitripennis]
MLASIIFQITTFNCMIQNLPMIERTERSACLEIQQLDAWVSHMTSRQIMARGAATAGGVVGGGCRGVAGLIRPDTATAPAPRCNLQGLAVLALNMCYIGALSFTRCCTCRSDLIEVDPQ